MKMLDFEYFDVTFRTCFGSFVSESREFPIPSYKWYLLEVCFEITREQKNTIKKKCIVIIIAPNVHVHIVCGATCCFLRRNLQNPGKFGLSARL